MSAAGVQARRSGRPPGSVGAHTRALLIDAARECFVRAGEEPATWAHIAARAGRSSGAVGLYFPSKQALYAEVAALTCTEVIAVGSSAAKHEPTLAGQVAAFLDAVMALHTSRPLITSFFAIALIDSYRRPDLRHANGSVHERLGDLLSRAVDAAVDRGELDEATDTLALVATLRMTILGACFHVANSGEDPISTAVIAGLHELMSGVLISISQPVLDPRFARDGSAAVSSATIRRQHPQKGSL